MRNNVTAPVLSYVTDPDKKSGPVGRVAKFAVDEAGKVAHTLVRSGERMIGEREFFGDLF